ncbi:hypothetical protein [Ralstonia phage phiRSL1]|uniref:Uncharacterized protein n=1 Tax=Ralstonia phage phiRSL1 TaxID=1980924 RepID=B2ZYJ4_9CAUD|nr:hypothetical protein RSL1_ORF323 [Ralstonia phage phiRSL1]BAG41770.1 hypothetical protein [Ralstonia phage phiRSL1]
MTTPLRYIRHRMQKGKMLHPGDSFFQPSYERVRSPKGEPVSGVTLIMDYACLDQDPHTRALSAAETRKQLERVTALVGRICDHLQLDLTQIIRATELEHEYHISLDVSSDPSTPDGGPRDAGGVLPTARPDGEG